MAETWVQFATKYYHQQKKSNPDYKFKNALKDAAPLFKKDDKKVEKNTKPVKEKKTAKKGKKGTRSKKN
tara:strand:- start:578 stop:784 length:207 start_codon:yes stop_codon:yes gene_type:complete